MIETKQEPDVILALRQRYDAGFDFGSVREESAETRVQREHEEQMRALDEELAMRRRSAMR